MKAPHTSHGSKINQLRRGATYCATTDLGSAIGEYLGIEAPHGTHAIILRRGTDVASIALNDVTSILPTAA